MVVVLARKKIVAAGLAGAAAVAALVYSIWAWGPHTAASFALPQAEQVDAVPAWSSPPLVLPRLEQAEPFSPAPFRGESTGGPGPAQHEPVADYSLPDYTPMVRTRSMEPALVLPDVTEVLRSLPQTGTPSSGAAATIEENLDSSRDGVKLGISSGANANVAAPSLPTLPGVGTGSLLKK